MTPNLRNIFIFAFVFGLVRGCMSNAKQTVSFTCSPINDTLHFLSGALDRAITLYSLDQFEVKVEFIKPFESNNMEIKFLSELEIIFNIDVFVPEVDLCYRYVSNSFMLIHCSLCIIALNWSFLFNFCRNPFFRYII